jgi:hypothetical protein
LTDAEIAETLPLRRADMRVIRSNVRAVRPGNLDNFLTGLGDCYHGILVGPCNPAAAEAEADCLMPASQAQHPPALFTAPLASAAGGGGLL